WQPLLAAQAHPSYVANHVAAAEAGAAILDAMFGGDTAAFSLTYDTTKSFATALGNPTFGPVTREFTSFEQAALETGLARVWGGVWHGSAGSDGCAVVEDGAVRLRQAERPRSDRRGQSIVPGSGAVDCPYGRAVAGPAIGIRQVEQCVQALPGLGEGGRLQAYV